MKLKNLFVVPEGQKISEKSLYRVLIANICSILLCMACLAGSTWAWFTVSIENTGNVIQIGRPEIDVYIDSVQINSGCILEGSHELRVLHGNSKDSLDNRHELYVTFTVFYADGVNEYYTVFLEGAQEELKLNIESAISYTLNWDVSWFIPVNTTLLSDNVIYAPSDKVAGSDNSDEINEGANGETGEGANGETGEGANGETGDGADDETGDGADDETGDGADGETGDGADDETGDGADGETGEDADGEPEEESEE